jgi:hypothetical protein
MAPATNLHFCSDSFRLPYVRTMEIKLKEIYKHILQYMKKYDIYVDLPQRRLVEEKINGDQDLIRQFR